MMKTHTIIGSLCDARARLGPRGVEHGVSGMIVIFDNHRMAAITELQQAQYGHGFRTGDKVAVDYRTLAGAVAGIGAFSGGTTQESLRQALQAAHAAGGLAVVHVPVYTGDDPMGGMGAYGAWNVGNWCADVQKAWIEQAI